MIVAVRRTNAAGIRLVQDHEGCSLCPYLDTAGLLTVGWGHLIRKDDPEWMRHPIMQEQADSLLVSDLETAERAVQQMVTVTLGDNEFAALVDFVFNLGRGAFGTSTLLRVLNQGRYGDVPDQLARWIYSGGKVTNGLVTRRRDEARLWSTPDGEEQVA